MTRRLKGTGLALASLSLVLAACASAPRLIQQDAVVTIASVYDGDSFRIEEGDGTIPIRVVGIDTPELRSAGRRVVPECEREIGLAARDFARERLLASRAVVTLQRQGKDRYDRTLARVFINGEPFDEIMIKAGHARPYDGGRREGWC